ncbi:MAG: DUF763 domain-containing protein [candidate division WOR-3 bacterium]
MKTGDVILPLHNGRAPDWLMQRMIKLARSIIYVMGIELGREEVLRRLSDPLWFQSLGCLLGFDWHSSGLTTTVSFAIKVALKDIGKELGIFAAGGKGRYARKTPDEIAETASKVGVDAEKLIYASRMSAKVDTCLVQDGYDIYHHTIFYTVDGSWCVIQQGMNERSRTARRYHWLSENLISFIEEPHTGIVAERKEKEVIDLTSRKSEDARSTMLQLVHEGPEKVLRLYSKALTYKMPMRHYITLRDMKPENLKKVLLTTYEDPPSNFEELLLTRGLGPMTIRALTLISDVIYGAKPSYSDPVIFSYAHGGKDGYPYRVRRDVYDKSIEILEKAIKSAKLGHKDELFALRKLSLLFSFNQTS